VNTFCVICKDLQNEDGSCECQPNKNTCDICKNIEDIDYCECKIDEYLNGLELPEADEADEADDEDDFCSCPACAAVLFGCSCGCGGSDYWDNEELWEQELNQCKLIQKEASA
jgi:hypothetical protein